MQGPEEEGEDVEEIEYLSDKMRQGSGERSPVYLVEESGLLPCSWDGTGNWNDRAGQRERS